MGGVESRFNGLIVDGNEEEALELWKSRPELQASYKPNVPIKWAPRRDTPLLSASRANMNKIMKELLSHGADPRGRNADGETALHVVCSSARFSSRTNRLRAELLTMLLDRLSPFEQSGRQDGELGNGVTAAEGEPFGVAGEVDPYNLALMDKVTRIGLLAIYADMKFSIWLCRIETLHFIWQRHLVY